MGDGGTPSPLPSPCHNPTQRVKGSPGPSMVTDSHEQKWQRLISGAAPQDELPSLIETIFSNKTTNIVDRLQESNAQAFINVIDGVRHQTLYF